MSNMQYGRAVSGKSTSLNVNLSGTRIASYNPQSSRGSSGSGSTFTSSTSTLDLSAFLTDNIDETIAKERIKNSKHYDSYQSGWDKVQDVIDKVGATCVVAYTSVVSGFIDVGEAVLDGSVWLTSKVVGLVSDDAETAMKEFIAKDLVSEANEWFYEQTDVGRAINDASALKYDSELAQGVRSVAEDVTVFVAATALSVVTCGAATPLVVMGVGALYGMGAAAQDTYAAHGTDTTTWQELMILGNGALSALSWYTSGKLGKGFIELGKSMAEAGVKEILAEMCRGIFSKETLKELFKPGNIVGNAIASLMQTGGDIGLIATKLYNGGEVTPEEWALLIGELIVYFGLNTAEDVLSDSIISYGNPKIDIDTTKTPDAPETPKTPDTQDTPISPTTMEGNGLEEVPTKTPDAPDKPNAPETLAETGLEDAVPKQPSADTPPQKQIETLDETEIIPEAKTPHPDDPYIDKALDILNTNTATKLSDEIGKLDDEGLQKLLTAMYTEGAGVIAAQLKDLDAKDMDRVLNALSGDQLTDVVGEIAERISKRELPSDILDKLDPVVRLEVLERTDPTVIRYGDRNQMLEIQEIYSGDQFKQKSNTYNTEWGNHNEYTGNLNFALEQQYDLLKEQGYTKRYDEFLSEYTSGTFDTSTGLHMETIQKFETNGGVSIMRSDQLESSINGTYGNGRSVIGYPDADGKKGGSWIVPMDEQYAKSTIPSESGMDSITLQRARKGITTQPDLNTNPYWEVQFSSDYLKENGITLNSGPNNIVGASAAAMPGAKTYDLTTEGVSFSEALCPQVQFDISPKNRAKIIASIRMGISVDMATYGYPGIIFAPAN